MKQTRSLELKSIVAGEEGDYYPLELAPASRDVDRVMRTVRDCVAEAEGFEVSFQRQLLYKQGNGGVSSYGVLVIALLLLYFILAAQFESLVQPLIILSEIVIDLFGAIVILWIFGADAQPDVDDRPDSGLRYCHQRLDSEDRHNKYPSASRYAYAARHTRGRQATP